MIDDIEAAAVALLLSHTTVTDSIGSRVYTDLLPEGVTFPAVSIQLISAQRITAPLFADADPNYVDTTLQIVAWSGSKKESKAVATAIRNAIRRWRGFIDGFEIQDITISIEGPHFFDGDLMLYASSTDYIFSHPE